MTPFPLGEHVRPITIQLSPVLALVLLAGPANGLLAALWCIGGRWVDATIGRA